MEEKLNPLETVYSCIFLTKNIICFCTSEAKVYFYDLRNNIIVKTLSFNKKKILEKQPFEIVRKNEYTILIIAYENIYEYNFTEDENRIIYENYYKFFQMESIFNEFVYSQLNDSLYFSVVKNIDKESGHYEIFINKFSLTDYTVEELCTGKCPRIVESRKCLYYIGDDMRSIRAIDLITNKIKSNIIDYELPIYSFVPNKNGSRILFFHRTKYQTFKGGYSYDIKVWNMNNNIISLFPVEIRLGNVDIVFPEDLL